MAGPGVRASEQVSTPHTKDHYTIYYSINQTARLVPAGSNGHVLCSCHQPALSAPPPPGWRRHQASERPPPDGRLHFQSHRCKVGHTATLLAPASASAQSRHRSRRGQQWLRLAPRAANMQLPALRAAPQPAAAERAPPPPPPSACQPEWHAAWPPEPSACCRMTASCCHRPYTSCCCTVRSAGTTEAGRFWPHCS